MPAVTAIQFTQDQMRALTGVSVETFRHWRKAVPYLATKTGKAARFSFPDLLGLAVTNVLVSALGVHIAAVSTGIDALFRLLIQRPGIMADGVVVFVTSTTASLHDDNDMRQALAHPALVVPLAPLIVQIQHALSVMPSPSQAILPFPPETVRSGA
jgi:hypothetical protein